MICLTKPESLRMGVRFREQTENAAELVGDVLGQSPSACSDGFAEQIMCVFIKPKNCMKIFEKGYIFYNNI